jgi:hypothetical protein
VQEFFSPKQQVKQQDIQIINSLSPYQAVQSGKKSCGKVEKLENYNLKFSDYE